MSVYMGIDWSQKKHDLAILDEGGKVIAQTVIPHQKVDSENWMKRERP